MFFKKKKKERPVIAEIDNHPLHEEQIRGLYEKGLSAGEIAHRLSMRYTYVLPYLMKIREERKRNNVKTA